ncbi:homeobox protein Hox-C3a-like, partial [Clarias magur]
EGSSPLDLHMVRVRTGHAEGHTWDSQDYFLQKPHATYASDSRTTSGIQLQCMKQVDQNKCNDVSVKSNGTSSDGVFFKNIYPWMREAQSASSSHGTPNCCQS